MVMKPGQFVVAIRTGKDYWHILDHRHDSEEEAVKRMGKFSFDGAVLEVKQMTLIATEEDV
jgi:hypothetical protein